MANLISKVPFIFSKSKKRKSGHGICDNLCSRTTKTAANAHAKPQVNMVPGRGFECNGLISSVDRGGSTLDGHECCGLGCLVVVHRAFVRRRGIRRLAQHYCDGVYGARDRQRTRKVSLQTEPIPAGFTLLVGALFSLAALIFIVRRIMS